MSILLLLIPVMMVLGVLGLFAFIWSVNSGQYSDLDGDRHRILDDHDTPLPPDVAKNQRQLTRPGDEN